MWVWVGGGGVCGEGGGSFRRWVEAVCAERNGGRRDPARGGLGAGEERAAADAAGAGAPLGEGSTVVVGGGGGVCEGGGGEGCSWLTQALRRCDAHRMSRAGAGRLSGVGWVSGGKERYPRRLGADVCVGDPSMEGSVAVGRRQRAGPTPTYQESATMWM